MPDEPKPGEPGSYQWVNPKPLHRSPTCKAYVCLTADGGIEMDAGIMEGHTLNVGAVASVELIKNPILLARKVLESPHILLVSHGAQQLAIEHGMSLCRREDLLTQRQYERWLKAREEVNEEPSYHRHIVGIVAAREEQRDEKKHGTIGAAALDLSGRLAAATSTGGIINKPPGRVGDSPLVGCGFYADENAAISCTGQGEDFIRLLIARRAADLVGAGVLAREAAEQTIALLEAKAQSTGGLILLDRRGDIGIAWNTRHMVHAYITSNRAMREPETGI